jgi:hypothetical protein
MKDVRQTVFELFRLLTSLRRRRRRAHRYRINADLGWNVELVDGQSNYKTSEWTNYESTSRRFWDISLCSDNNSDWQRRRFPYQLLYHNSVCLQQHWPSYHRPSIEYILKNVSYHLKSVHLPQQHPSTASVVQPTGVQTLIDWLHGSMSFLTLDRVTIPQFLSTPWPRLP